MMEDSARARSSAFASRSCSLPDATPQPGNKSRRRRQRCPQPVFELSADVEGRPSVALLARHKPVALVALMPKGLVLFTAGAMAGAVGKTLTAPLDRLKILMQVKGAMSGGALQEAANSGSLLKAFVAIGKQQGITSYWKGNLPQVQLLLALLRLFTRRPVVATHSFPASPPGRSRYPLACTPGHGCSHCLRTYVDDTGFDVFACGQLCFASLSSCVAQARRPAAMADERPSSARGDA